MLPLQYQTILDAETERELVKGLEKALRKVAKGKATVRVIKVMPKITRGTIRDENWRLK